MKAPDTCSMDVLSAYVDGELTDGERVAVAAHLGSCLACRDLLEDLGRLSGAMADDAVPPVPAGLASRIARRLDERAGTKAPARVAVPLASGVKAPRRPSIRRGWIGPPLAAAAALATAAVLWTAWQAGSGSGLESARRPTAASPPPVAAESSRANESGDAIDSDVSAGRDAALEKTRAKASARKSDEGAGDDRETRAERTDGTALSFRQQDVEQLGAVERAGDAMEPAGSSGTGSGKGDARSKVLPAEPESTAARRVAAERRETIEDQEAVSSSAAVARMADSGTDGSQASIPAVLEDVAQGEAAEEDRPMTMKAPHPLWVSELETATRSLVVRAPTGVITLSANGLLVVEADAATCETLWDGGPVSMTPEDDPAADKVTPAAADSAGRSGRRRADLGAAAFEMPVADQPPSAVRTALASLFSLAEYGARDNEGAAVEEVGSETVANAPAAGEVAAAGAPVELLRADGTVVLLDPAADPETARVVALLRARMSTLVDTHYRDGLDSSCAAVVTPDAVAPGPARQP